jgi:hypothetical protein
VKLNSDLDYLTPRNDLFRKIKTKKLGYKFDSKIVLEEFNTMQDKSSIYVMGPQRLRL